MAFGLGAGLHESQAEPGAAKKQTRDRLQLSFCLSEPPEKPLFDQASDIASSVRSMLQSRA